MSASPNPNPTLALTLTLTQVSTAERQRATVARQGKAGGGKPGANPKKKRRAVEIGGRPKPV